MHKLHVVRGPRQAFDRIRLDEALFRDPLKRTWLVLDGVGERFDRVSVILGISGKIPVLVHEPEARRDGVELLRRFTGGGTVVVDSNAFLISIIGNASQLSSRGGVKPFPRELMQWSANCIYTPAFAHSRSNPEVELSFRENDYVINQRAKVAGNAQAISGDRFCHHTSFLWRVDPKSMSYLKHPDKMPEYRADRSHLDFLLGLESMLECKEVFEDQVLLQLQRNLDVDQVVFPPHPSMPPFVAPSRNRIC
ncbi:hypothetical protein BASA81_002421 [Batrachochytrium salamandrivorans]|nr:hypothetical protein BASA81_002421 [Batrachochytrium salamandrivorans]